MIGETLGSYRILEKLGEGGMGVVYKAEHVLIGRKAALKLLSRELSTNQTMVGRFFNEARATSMIEHPGLVDVNDFGYHEGRAFIVMEYLNGEPLSGLIRRERRLAVPVLASLARQTANALGAAHAKGIIHRDLKPDNVFLLSDREMASGLRVKVLDFGIAKLVDDAQNVGHHHTNTGTVMGTPRYMSPEQCRGAGGVDYRADIYSLGCMMFEMVCGQTPFERAGSGETLAAHIYEQPPRPAQFDPSIPPALEALILQCLAKDPAQRPRAMAEVEAALAPFARQSSHLGVVMGGPSMPMNAWPTPHPMTYPPGTSPSYTPPPGAGPSFPPGTSPPHVPPGTGPQMPPGTYPGGAPHGATPPPTTLGGAASQVAAAAPARKKPLIVFALVLLVVGGGIGLAAALANRSSTDKKTADAPTAPTPEAPTPTPTPTPAPAPAPTPAPPTTTAPAPSEVTIKIVSDPAGADVYRAFDGLRVGTTPFEQKFPHTEADAVYVLRKSGFRDHKVEIRLTADATREIKLESRSSSSSSAPATIALPTPPATPAPVTVVPTMDPPPVTVVATPTPVTTPPPSTPAPTPPPVTPPPTPPKPRSAKVVAPNAVTKVSGSSPKVEAKVRGKNISGDVAAKLCIDEAGRVTNVDVMIAANEIRDSVKSTLKQWRYKPYVEGGQAIPVCFAVAMKIKIESD